MHKKLPGQESVYKRDLQLSDMGPGRHSCKLIHILLEMVKEQIAAYGKGKGSPGPEFILQKPGPRFMVLIFFKGELCGRSWLSWPGMLSQFSALSDTFAFIAADGFSCLIPAPGLCPYSCSGGGFLNGQSQFAASEPDLFSQICISLDRLLCHDHSSSFTDWSLCSRYVTIKESCQPLFCLMKRS